MLAIISSYFNPNKCPYRLANYQRFRQELSKERIPLFTFELAFGDAEFEIKAEKEHLTQARTNDLMFQKERTLNLLLESLPSEYNNVCWMDCDLFYVQEQWVERVEKELETYKVVQPFSWSVCLPFGDWVKLGSSHVQSVGQGPCNFRRSFGYYHAHRRQYTNFHEGHVGYIWAAHRDFLDKHKFYDTIVTGCGDLFMAMACAGNFGFLDFDPCLNNMRQDTVNHFYDWGTPVHEDVDQKIGYTEDLILHMWHGDLNKRNYLQHSKTLQNFDFHPDEDLELDENGLWKWKRENPKLHSYIKNMFDKQKAET